MDELESERPREMALPRPMVADEGCEDERDLPG